MDCSDFGEMKRVMIGFLFFPFFFFFVLLTSHESELQNLSLDNSESLAMFSR